MKELEQAVSTAFAKIVASGAIEQAIQAKLQTTIATIISEQLRDYSDFGKLLGEHVQRALKVDFDNLDLPAYNDLILKIIRAKVDAGLQQSLSSQIEQQMTELLAPAPAEIKLSELVADFIKEQTEFYGCSCDGPSRITLEVFRNDTHDGYCHIYLDKNQGIERYQCAYQIAVNPKGHVYSLKVHDVDPKRTIFVGPLYRFDRRLFQLHTSGTKLIVDDEDGSISTYYPGHD